MTMSVPLRTPNPALRLQPARFGASLEFGVDPAIEADSGRHAPFDRRRVSLRWFAGTLLTGLSGGVLIGAAIYAALGHQAYLAEVPSPALAPRKEINLDFGVNPHKGDRLVKSVDIVAEKQSFQAPATVRSGDKEVMKVHTFTHVQTTLTLASFGLSDDVPPFNPLKVLAGARNPMDAGPEPVQDDAEVSWSTRDLSGQTFSPRGRVIDGRGAGPGRRASQKHDGGRRQTAAPAAAAASDADLPRLSARAFSPMPIRPSR